MTKHQSDLENARWVSEEGRELQLVARVKSWRYLGKEEKENVPDS